MKLEFHGAAQCVTGSSHLLVVNGKKILLDCGMYQGRDEKERGNDEFDFDPKTIDFVILTHAHIDHSGRIPLLYKKGFKGQVICTEATMELCSAMLPDSGHIQEMEVEWRNRKRIRQGLEPIEPIYTAKIAEIAMYLFKGYPYDEFIELFDGFNLIFRDAGHLLGSAIVEIFVKEPDKKEVKLVYTGDLGNLNIPLIKDPTQIDYADYLIMETTYGNRLHEKAESQLKQLVQIIKDTFERGGNVIIPSFAVGRTQEVLYAISQYIEEGQLKDIIVYVDSPLASESTKIFKKYRSYYDEDALKMLNEGNNPLDFEGLNFTKTPEESTLINKIESGAIVISASGMCEAGRIKHHLKHNLWRKECSIVFVGYQAEGTLGRSILEGTTKVKIFGEEIVVNAHIYNLEGLSGHADRNGLISWVEAMKKKPKEIMLVHGDNDAQNSFKELLDSKGYKSRIMKPFEQVGINEIISMEEQTKSKLRANIDNLLDSLKEIDNLDKNLLMEKLRKVVFKE